MYLSECDQISSPYHVPSIYFYAPASYPILEQIDVLKKSLSKALVRFYPLAGRLKKASGGRLELDCNAMGALLIEAESDSKMAEFGDFKPSHETLALAPNGTNLDFDSNPFQEVPLLLVQVTKFSCGGIAVALGLCSTLVDGQSQGNFVNQWAKIARGEDPGKPPFLDRRILQPRESSLSPFGNCHNHLEFNPPPLLLGHSDNSQMLSKATTVAMLKLSTEQIVKLRNMANESGIPNNNKRGYSRFEAIAGHIWKCASKVRRLHNQQQTRLDFPVDFRKLMKPTLPQDYFGRCTIQAVAITTAGKLLSEPLGYASAKIREAINMISDEYVRSHILYIKNQQYRTKGQYEGNPNLYMTNWAGLSFSGVDFGWGKEIYTGPVRVSSEGKGYMLRSPDGDGSMILALRLHLEDMDPFKKLFYQEIDGIISKY